MRLIGFLALILFVVVTQAHDVYRWVEPDGCVCYSDQPHPGAQIITLPKLPPPQPRRYMRPPQPRVTATAEPYRYNQLMIESPKPGETVRDNIGDVEVVLAVEPRLDVTEGHKIQLILDGNAEGHPSPNLVQWLMGVDRGKHSVAAQVIDKRHQILVTSQPITFFLNQASPLFHPPRWDTPRRGVQQAPRAPMAPRAPRAPHVPFRPASPPPPPR